MIYKLILNDFKTDKLTNSIVFLFISLASFLLSIIFMVATDLNQSIDDFMVKSQPPHFMQMHLGDLNKERLAAFALDNKQVVNYQVLDFLNIDVNDIQINGEEFPIQSQDNGFVCQSPRFDFLLDQANQRVSPQTGEVYVPLAYLLDGVTKKGDQLTVAGRKFTVQGGIRDGQMAPMLASSKRFVIHPTDFQGIQDHGKLEYLIEFRLKDPSQLHDFQVDFLKQGLETNGPTITGPIIKLINALSEGILLALLSLLAFLIISISLLCLHFSLSAKLEEDFQMIGILKALGIQSKRIKSLYGYKYQLLAGLAGLVGLVGSFLSKPIFLEEIALFYGLSDSRMRPILAGIIGAGMVLVVVRVYVSFMLRKIDRISAADAQAMAYANTTKRLCPKMKLRQSPQIATSLLIASNKILGKKRYFIIYACILIFLSLSMALPSSLYASIASQDFINYLGLSDVDVLVEVKNPDQAKLLKQYLAHDPRPRSYQVFDQINYDLLLDGKAAGKLQTRLGGSDHFQGSYSQGRPAVGKQEISISYLTADELDKDVGDKLTLSIQGKARDMVIAGIYSDISNGGRTARAHFKDSQSPKLGQLLFINLHDPKLAESFAGDLKGQDPNLALYPTKAYQAEFLGPTLTRIRSARLGSLGLSLVLAWFISYLFFNMLISQDRAELIVQKILGLRLGQIRKPYLVMTVIICSLSLGLAFVLTYFIGGFLLDIFMRRIGVANMPFDLDWLRTFLIHPGLLMLTTTLSTCLASRQISRLQMADYQEV
ncbi:hypothetical protein ODY46_06855 [Aerococcus sp. CDC-944-U94]|uniref:FtsX-like permease family protein n=1 Tax=Aerococcus urinae (strain CCUG 59500 / ACS-120-V-Col10a) TaxID=2976812 RepID=UPI00227A08B6|nr:FtsX-like permease family protein [Aerococcus sp. Group 1]MCY3055448.1 hypothetical protein [Aerococcus sp. Group 1]MCY3057178.1 hypothetical protein [Aerococcus sp. Group 1]